MRAIKKIVALATGATMLGATIMGAMAADLADYPAPYVSGCDFDGAIGVGDTAASEDVVGAIDVISTLAVSGTTTETSTTTTTSATGESVKIATSTNEVNVGETLTSVKTVDIDDDDLPVILADGTYSNDDSEEFEYEQRLKFNDAVDFTFKSDNDYKKDVPTLMVYSNKKKQFMNYTLDFTKDAEDDTGLSTLTDFDDTTLNFLGKEYDITDAENVSGKISLTLMAGTVKDILEQGQIKTYTLNGKDYEVEVTFIGGTTSQVKFKINGETTDSLQVAQTKKLSDGTTIGVREILEEEAGEVTADQVEFYLGAEKIKLEDSDRSAATIGSDNVEMNDEDVDDLYVGITATDSGAKLMIDKIVLVWRPDDEIFVTEDMEAVMPGLEAYKVSMGAFTAPAMEETLIENNGDNSIELTAEIESGKVSFDIVSGNESKSGWSSIGGEDYGENLTLSTGAAIDYDMDTDQYFIASDSDAKETYLLEVTKIDADGVTVKDAANNVKYENKKNGTAFSIGGVTLTPSGIYESNDSVTFTRGATTGNFYKVYTKEGLTINLPVLLNGSSDGSLANQEQNGTANTTITLVYREEDKDENIDAGISSSITLGFTSNKAAVTGVTKTELEGDNYYEIGDTDEFVGYFNSSLATEVYYDTDPDQDTVRLVYHGGESYANIYVAEMDSRISASGAAGGLAVCKVSVPAAKLASEIADVTAQNLILVGGPCANAAAATVMGVAGTVPECLEGFEEGKAMIKLYEQTTGKVAMVVAGMTALDTRRATRVLKNYETYDLSGDEVEVTGTSLADISVSAPTAATE